MAGSQGGLCSFLRNHQTVFHSSCLSWFEAPREGIATWEEVGKFQQTYGQQLSFRTAPGFQQQTRWLRERQKVEVGETWRGSPKPMPTALAFCMVTCLLLTACQPLS